MAVRSRVGQEVSGMSGWVRCRGLLRDGVRLAMAVVAWRVRRGFHTFLVFVSYRASWS